MTHRAVLVWVFLLVFPGAVCDGPIIKVEPGCPNMITGVPTLVLSADVPAHAAAKCKNGKKVFSAVSSSSVRQQLFGTFATTYAGDRCQFKKKAGSNTFTVDVEVGWGEETSAIVGRKRLFTMTCAYDTHGKALSAPQAIGDSFIAPRERQYLKGDNSSASFHLELLDVLDNAIANVDIDIGRKVRLKARDNSKSVVAFRALSCEAINEMTSYPVLRAGCGDGLVFPKWFGFETIGNEVYSPYFETFKLTGSSTVQFKCIFTICTTPCDGDSCTSLARRRRSKKLNEEQRAKDESQPRGMSGRSITLKSHTIRTRPPKSANLLKDFLRLVKISILGLTANESRLHEPIFPDAKLFPETHQDGNLLVGVSVLSVVVVTIFLAYFCLSRVQSTGNGDMFVSV